MKKRLLGILILTLILIISAFGLVACGSSEKASEGLQYVLINANEYEVVGIGECEDANVVIPSKYKNKPVTSICGFAFEGCRWLRSVVIPDSVTNIGESAFSGCVSLTSIEIPNSVTSIGEGAFSGCVSLTSLTIPFVGATKDGAEKTHFGYIFGASSWPDNDDHVPSSLKTVIITSVTSIGDSAFSYCSSLTSVVIGDSVTSIGDSAFYYCRSLTSIVIGDSVTSIGSWAFRDCTSLTSIEIPNSVTSIDSFAFSGCTSLTSVEIPNSVTRISSNTFYNCRSLTSITFNGTKAEWSKIEKSPYWEEGIKAKYVTCTDGTVNI